MVHTMNRLFNINTLTETQKNALFAFGEKDKVGTGCNLMIAAGMCEGQLSGVILMVLADLIDSVGITNEEFEQLLYQIRMETNENIMNMKRDYLDRTGKAIGDLPWRAFARKKMLATFGSDDCGETVRRLAYIHHVTVDPDLKKIVKDLGTEIGQINVFHPEKYPELLAEARKVDELWRIRTDDLSFFTVND
jgi:hypothetical protein